MSDGTGAHASSPAGLGAGGRWVGPGEAARRKVSSRALAGLVLVGLLSLGLAAGCAESRAEKAFQQAVAKEKEGSLEPVRDDLREITEQWPKTDAARKARRELQWIETLLTAEARGPSLLAWDAVREVSNAAERFRMVKGRYPRTLDEMVPRYLDGPVRDPWGSEIVYRRTKKGYQVVCYGEDGIPGGSDLGTDLLIDTGDVIEGRAGGEPR